MDSKAVITVTVHIAEKHNGHFFLKALSKEHADELGVVNHIVFEKSTDSFVGSAAIIQDKMKKIEEILNEDG